MEDNIEVKDVQKTEYLDKNGLDMLWTKIKENTHNQVEVERNRAVAKENSISDKVDNLKYVPYTKLELSRYNIPDGISTGYITSKGDDNDSFDVYPNTELTSGTLYGGVTIHSESDEYHSTKEIKVDYDDMRIKFTDGTPSNVYAIYGEKGVDLKINNSSQSLLTADQSVKVIGTDIAPLENGKVPEEYLDLSQYAKKTDIPEVDTSDFVSKSDTITQTINSGLIAMDELNVFSKSYYDQTASLRGGIFVEGADTKLVLNDTTAQHNSMVLTASKLSMSQQVGDNTLLITTSGIANTDNNANHVYATDGSIADLTQYAKKSEISAGGNVNDVQVNGVSVVENKIANIKPATKEKLGVVKVGDGLNVADGTISVDTTAIGTGNYIPYESIDDKFGNNMYITKRNEGILFKSGAGNVSISDGEIQIKNTVSGLSLTNSFIWLKEISNNGSTETLLVQLDKNGLRLRDGDNDHVLTSYGSTIDITQYALKSVYDKKIAALEARIAALEAKHAEAA